MEKLDQQKIDLDLLEIEKQIMNFSRPKILAALSDAVKKTTNISTINSFLMTASSGISDEVRKQVSELFTKLKSDQISIQEASTKFQLILKAMELELKEELLLKNFLKAKKNIITLMHITDVLDDKDLRKKLSNLFQDGHSFYDRIDLSKTGIFVDEDKNKIYFVDEIILPEIKDKSIKKMTIDTKIKEASLEQIAQFCSQNKIKVTYPLFFNLNQVILANRSDDERIVQFLFEVNGVHYGSDERIDITQNILSTLLLKQQRLHQK